jgi:hypothetical protein
MEKIKVTESELKEIFLKDIKLFKRFLKDNGAFPSIYEYVLPKNKMTIDEFYEKCKSLYLDAGAYLNYDFRDILHILSTIEISYHEMGHGHWVRNIESISIKFIDYYGKKNGLRKKYELVKDVVEEAVTIDSNYYVWDGSTFTTTTQG